MSGVIIRTGPARHVQPPMVRLQAVIQWICLGVFVLLILLGKNQLWMLLFAVSALLSTVFGRFYCGWICPIQTVMSAVDGLTRKGIPQKRALPAWMMHPASRIAFLIAFVSALAFTLFTGRRLPILPALLGAGALLVLFFPASLWHRRLCPFGAILSMTARPARKYLKVNSNRCAQCGVCGDICPGGAVMHGVHVAIEKRLCLQCSACRVHCPAQAIRF